MLTHMIPRVAAEAETLVQLALFGEALDHAPVAILLKTETGQYAAVNHAACELTGYTRDELMALPPDSLSGRGSDELRRNLDRFSRGGTLPGRTPLLRKDGAVIEVDYRWIKTIVGGMPFMIFFMTPAGTPIFEGTTTV